MTLKARKLKLPTIIRKVLRMERESITSGEFLEALEKNGHPWGKGHFYNPADNSSCAVGQVMRNLGINHYDHHIGWIMVDNLYSLFRLRIVDKNDSDSTESYQEVVDYAKSIIGNRLDVEIPLTHRIRS
jgi:hypothetical protein